mmetsp:Transcript_16064/g.40451  ORF Transcript_16064/g.40451 Transcript_16064/m.40451 type:complete len:210 (-) Transcript_16064:510-1139(-)
MGICTSCAAANSKPLLRLMAVSMGVGAAHRGSPSGEQVRRASAEGDAWCDGTGEGDGVELMELVTRLAMSMGSGVLRAAPLSPSASRGGVSQGAGDAARVAGGEEARASSAESAPDSDLLLLGGSGAWPALAAAPQTEAGAEAESRRARERSPPRPAAPMVWDHAKASPRREESSASPSGSNVPSGNMASLWSNGRAAYSAGEIQRHRR